MAGRAAADRGPRGGPGGSRGSGRRRRCGRPSSGCPRQGLIAGPGRADRPAVVTRDRARSRSWSAAGVASAGRRAPGFAVVFVAGLAAPLVAGRDAGALRVEPAAGVVDPPVDRREHRLGERGDRVGRLVDAVQHERLDLEGDQPMAALDLDASSPGWTRFQRTSLPAARGPSPGTLTRTSAGRGRAASGRAGVADGRVVPPGHPARGRARRRGPPAPARGPP